MNYIFQSKAYETVKLFLSKVIIMFHGSGIPVPSRLDPSGKFLQTIFQSIIS